MKTMILCAALLAAFCSVAQADPLRERCAAQVGASKGPAYNACVKEALARPKGNYKSPGERGRCRMGNC